MNPALAELHLDLQSDPALVGALRRQIEAFAMAAGFGEGAAGDIGLCVNEAFTNVIRHAYAGQPGRPIQFKATIENGRLVMTLRDWGNGRVPDLRRMPADRNPLQPGGLGLPCLKQLLDGVEFIPQPDGMLLKMVRQRR